MIKKRVNNYNINADIDSFRINNPFVKSKDRFLLINVKNIFYS